MANSTNGLTLGKGLRQDAQSRIADDRLALYVFIFFLISIIGQALLLIINWGELPPEIPLFYSRPWGDLMLAAPIYLWILPSVTVIFFAMNYFIALFLLKEQYFLSRVLIVFSAIVSFATSYDMTRIIGLLV